MLSINLPETVKMEFAPLCTDEFCEDDKPGFIFILQILKAMKYTMTSWERKEGFQSATESNNNISVLRRKIRSQIMAWIHWRVCIDVTSGIPGEGQKGVKYLWTAPCRGQHHDHPTAACPWPPLACPCSRTRPLSMSNFVPLPSSPCSGIKPLTGTSFMLLQGAQFLQRSEDQATLAATQSHF